MARFRTWLTRRRWYKQHKADIRAFMRFQAERIERREAARSFH